MESKFLILILIVNQVAGLGVKLDGKSHAALDDAILSLFKRNPLEESPRIANLMFKHGVLPHDDMLTEESSPAPPQVISEKLFKDMTKNTNDAEISSWLSKMSDEQLMDLLRQKTDEKEYNLDDFMNVVSSDGGTESKQKNVPEEINKLTKLNNDVIVVDQLIPINNAYGTPLPESKSLPERLPFTNFDFMTSLGLGNNREPNDFVDKVQRHDETLKYIESNNNLLAGQRELKNENIALRKLLDDIVSNQYRERIPPMPKVRNKYQESISPIMMIPKSQVSSLWENMVNIPSGIVLPDERIYGEKATEMLEYNLQKDKEQLFDALVDTLKMLCCSPSSRRSSGASHEYDRNTALVGTVPPFLQWALKQKKEKHNKSQSRRTNDENKVSKPQEQLFLVLNEEIPGNGTDELVTVDPDSLSSNSTVLPLGPITDDLNDTDLKTVMNKVSNELRKDEYKELISQLAKGINNEAVPGKLMLDSEVTRRYFRPHRCNHRSQISRLSGSTRWLVCTGYIGMNYSSVYDG